MRHGVQVLVVALVPRLPRLPVPALGDDAVDHGEEDHAAVSKGISGVSLRSRSGCTGCPCFVMPRHCGTRCGCQTFSHEATSLPRPWSAPWLPQAKTTSEAAAASLSRCSSFPPPTAEECT